MHIWSNYWALIASNLREVNTKENDGVGTKGLWADGKYLPVLCTILPVLETVQ